MLLHKYKKSWVDDFTEIKFVLEEVLGSNCDSIEHVGSTSVPKLDAKSIIDIDIVFDSSILLDNIIENLSSLGYKHIGNLGITDRDAFIRENENHPVLDNIVHHLYVCPLYSLELKRHLLFRNYLIQNEDARLKYEQLKYEIAEEANQDKKVYAAIKEVKASEFIETIILKAKSNIVK